MIFHPREGDGQNPFAITLQPRRPHFIALYIGGGYIRLPLPLHPRRHQSPSQAGTTAHTFCNLDKYILQFFTSDKYILHIRKIPFVIWTNTFYNLDKSLPLHPLRHQSPSQVGTTSTRSPHCSGAAVEIGKQPNKRLWTRSFLCNMCNKFYMLEHT